MKSILHIENLEIGYANKSLLQSVNLSFNLGELVGVFGINGAGKSTLLKTLSREIPALNGEINLNDRPIKDFAQKDFARQLSVVLTHQNFSQNISVRELIALGRFPYNNWLGMPSAQDKDQILNIVHQLELTPLLHKKCIELSDGQLQKVFIARALVQDTPIILLDEPTNHLDLYYKFYVFKLLKQIASKQNKAIIVATHELNLALQLCDKILLMTTDKATLDTPDNLIKSHAFQTLFPNDMVHFNAALKSFELQLKK